jgi:hypothetical protein
MKPPDDGPNSIPRLTQTLLTAGVVAGPMYVVVGAIEAFVRPGFDPTLHDLSLLSNGEWGWVHVTMLVATGLLTMAAAIGMRRVLTQGRGRLWGPLLIGLYGLGLIGAGAFSADPALGFPPGTPADAHTVSGMGLLHFVSGGVGFVGLIAGCFVFARRFAALGQRAWSTYSLLTGIVFFAGFIGIAMGSNGPSGLLRVVVLSFTAAVVMGWTWVTALSARLRGERGV